MILSATRLADDFVHEAKPAVQVEAQCGTASVAARERAALGSKRLSASRPICRCKPWLASSHQLVPESRAKRAAHSARCLFEQIFPEASNRVGDCMPTYYSDVVDRL